MNIVELIKKNRHIITIALALIGIGLMAYYDYCDTACSYLQGDILGMDLKWVGITYMSAIILFAAFKQMSFVRALLAAGLGVEVYLYYFQIENDVYCPFCLAFSVMLILSFLINYEVPSAWRENRRRIWLYFLGEVSFPMFRLYKLPLLLFSIAGYLTILLTFSGSVTPAFGQINENAVPSIGKGHYEIIMFTDYFCPPCRRIDTKAEPLLKELLATGKVKITFVDVPFAQATPVYAKYYLYAANADASADNIFNVRNLFFEAAQGRHIQEEIGLLAFIKEKNIKLKPLDEKSVFPILTAIAKDNKVRATPTCVIRYSAKDTKTFVGDTEIWGELKKLKGSLTAKK
ncbi:MAG TPA: thioredoxin domain-containing protein [Smithella sp.]|nr:thioredoxin domain-containing protein [Smithella sp.]